MGKTTPCVGWVVPLCLSMRENNSSMLGARKFNTYDHRYHCPQAGPPGPSSSHRPDREQIDSEVSGRRYYEKNVSFPGLWAFPGWGCVGRLGTVNPGAPECPAPEPRCFFARPPRLDRRPQRPTAGVASTRRDEKMTAHDISIIRRRASEGSCGRLGRGGLALREARLELGARSALARLLLARLLLELRAHLVGERLGLLARVARDGRDVRARRLAGRLVLRLDDDRVLLAYRRGEASERERERERATAGSSARRSAPATTSERESATSSPRARPSRWQHGESRLATGTEPGFDSFISIISMASHERVPASIHGHDESHDRPVTTAEEDRSAPTGGVRPRVEQYGTAQYGTVEYGPAQCIHCIAIVRYTAQPSPAHSSALHYGMYSTAQSSPVQCIALRYTAQPSPAQSSALHYGIQHSPVQPSPGHCITHPGGARPRDSTRTARPRCRRPRRIRGSSTARSRRRPLLRRTWSFVEFGGEVRTRRHVLSLSSEARSVRAATSFR